MKDEVFQFEVLCAQCDGQSLPEGVDGVMALSKCLGDYSLEELVSFGSQLMMVLKMVREAAKVQVKANPLAVIELAQKLGMELDGEKPFQWPEELSEKIN